MPNLNILFFRTMSAPELLLTTELATQRTYVFSFQRTYSSSQSNFSVQSLFVANLSINFCLNLTL
jgi:hypothetical protein